MIRRLGEAARLTDFVRHDAAVATKQQRHLDELENTLQDLWNLGRNLVLVWSHVDGGLDLLVVPHYVTALAVEPDRETGREDSQLIIQSILAGPKQVAPGQLKRYAAMFGYDPVFFPTESDWDVSDAAISDLVKRYGITYIDDRAVALFDIVGFSLFSPLEQVTQLNSLSYSVNSAHSKMLSKKMDISFTRTTTGDGFYVWNRDRSIQANVNLYHFMHLVLADNAIARQKSRGNVTPLLRAAFHVGGHYEYYQSEGLNPTIYSYIVGNVTIELARLIERAIPGQVVVGDFQVPMPDTETRETVRVDTQSFIERTQKTLSSLEGLVLSGEPVDAIKCYLTGDRDRTGGYSIKRYVITDKHGLTRYGYNAKINIYRENADPIFLGVQDQNLDAFAPAADELDASVASG